MAAAISQPTSKRPPPPFASPAAAKAASLKAVAIRRARSQLASEFKGDETVSRGTRAKAGGLIRFVMSKVKPGSLAITNINDFVKLIQAADTVFAWSAKDSPQQHLHLHDVGKMLAEREESVSKPVRDVETPVNTVNGGEFQTHQPEK